MRLKYEQYNSHARSVINYNHTCTSSDVDNQRIFVLNSQYVMRWYETIHILLLYI